MGSLCSPSAFLNKSGLKGKSWKLFSETKDVLLVEFIELGTTKLMDLRKSTVKL